MCKMKWDHPKDWHHTRNESYHLCVSDRRLATKTDNAKTKPIYVPSFIIWPICRTSVCGTLITGNGIYLSERCMWPTQIVVPCVTGCFWVSIQVEEYKCRLHKRSATSCQACQESGWRRENLFCVNAWQIVTNLVSYMDCVALYHRSNHNLEF